MSTSSDPARPRLVTTPASSGPSSPGDERATPLKPPQRHDSNASSNCGSCPDPDSDSSSSSDDEGVDLDGHKVTADIPRPLGRRRSTIPSMAYPERPRQLGSARSAAQPAGDESPSPGSLRPHHHHLHQHHHHHHHHEEVPDPNLPRPRCSICGDEPRAYGLLQNCDHAFCVDCLRQWRQQGTTDDENELTSNFKCCPLCRTQSLLCVRSVDFVTGEAKRARIDQALAPKKSSPCRYFTKSLSSSRGPFCPLGDDCFYLHQLNGRPFRFGVGAEQMQARLNARRRVAQHRSYPTSEDEASDTESTSSHPLPNPNHQPITLRLFRSGSLGRARIPFGGAGLGLTPMTPSPAGSPRLSPVPHVGEAKERRASSSTAPGEGAPSDCRSPLAAVAAAARKARAARAASISTGISQGKLPAHLLPLAGTRPGSAPPLARTSPALSNRALCTSISVPTPGMTPTSSAASLPLHSCRPSPVASPHLQPVDEDKPLPRARTLPSPSDLSP